MSGNFSTYRDSRRGTSSSLFMAPINYGSLTRKSLLTPWDKEEDKAYFKEIIEDGSEIEFTYEELLERAGTGCFQYMLTFICGLIFMSCCMSAAVMGFILPATKCKLAIMSVDRGFIISSGLIGMVLGTFTWSAVSNQKGRRTTLLYCLAMESVAAIFTAFSFHKYMLLLVRFFNGFGSIGVASLVFAYASDFIVPRHKDFFITTLEAFWGIALIYIPLVAMFIIPLKFQKVLGPFKLQSWNVFALVCAILPVTSFILLLFLPESPVYLLYEGKIGSTLLVLERVYKINKGVHLNVAVKAEDSPERTQDGFFLSLKTNLRDHVELFSKKYLIRTLKICSIAALVNFSYLTLSIWTPTLLDRHDYEKHLTGREMTFCKAAIHVGDSLEKQVECNDEIAESVYIFTIVIFLFILPLAGAFSLALAYVGRNELLIFITIMAGVSCLFLNVVEKKFEIIISCIFFHTADLIETMLFLFAVHLYPPHLCPMALALIVTSGRTAAIIGNTMFGLLIDKYCYVPMYLFAITIFLAVLTEMSLPRIEIWN